MENRKWKAAVVTLSDKGYAGEREDKSGPLVCEILRDAGYDVQKTKLLPDEQKEIEKYLCKLCDDDKMDIIFTTGGTGFSPRDCTPEADAGSGDKKCAGDRGGDETRSLKITPRAMLSRGASVIRNSTLIVNLPGSPKAAKENLEAVLPSLQHGLEILPDVRENARDSVQRFRRRQKLEEHFRVVPGRTELYNMRELNGKDVGPCRIDMEEKLIYASVGHRQMQSALHLLYAAGGSAEYCAQPDPYL